MSVCILYIHLQVYSTRSTNVYDIVHNTHTYMYTSTAILTCTTVLHVQIVHVQSNSDSTWVSKYYDLVSTIFILLLNGVFSTVNVDKKYHAY